MKLSQKKLITIMVLAIILTLLFSSVAMAAGVPQYIFYRNAANELVRADYQQAEDDLFPPVLNPTLMNAIREKLRANFLAGRAIYVEDEDGRTIDYLKAARDGLTYAEAYPIFEYWAAPQTAVKELIIDPISGLPVERPLVRVVSVSAVNDLTGDTFTVTAELTAEPAIVPEEDHFDVVVEIDGVVAPDFDTFSWDAADLEATFTWPAIQPIATDQDVDFSVAYKDTPPLSGTTVIEAGVLEVTRVEAFTTNTVSVSLNRAPEPGVIIDEDDFEVTVNNTDRAVTNVAAVGGVYTLTLAAPILADEDDVEINGIEDLAGTVSFTYLDIIVNVNNANEAGMLAALNAINHNPFVNLGALKRQEVAPLFWNREKDTDFVYVDDIKDAIDDTMDVYNQLLLGANEAQTIIQMRTMLLAIRTQYTGTAFLTGELPHLVDVTDQKAEDALNNRPVTGFTRLVEVNQAASGEVLVRGQITSVSGAFDRITLAGTNYDVIDGGLQLYLGTPGVPAALTTIGVITTARVVNGEVIEIRKIELPATLTAAKFDALASANAPMGLQIEGIAAGTAVAAAATVAGSDLIISNIDFGASLAGAGADNAFNKISVATTTGGNAGSTFNESTLTGIVTMTAGQSYNDCTFVASPANINVAGIEVTDSTFEAAVTVVAGGNAANFDNCTFEANLAISGGDGVRVENSTLEANLVYTFAAGNRAVGAKIIGGEIEGTLVGSTGNFLTLDGVTLSNAAGIAVPAGVDDLLVMNSTFVGNLSFTGGIDSPKFVSNTFEGTVNTTNAATSCRFEGANLFEGAVTLDSVANFVQGATFNHNLTNQEAGAVFKEVTFDLAAPRTIAMTEGGSFEDVEFTGAGMATINLTAGQAVTISGTFAGNPTAGTTINTAADNELRIGTVSAEPTVVSNVELVGAHDTTLQANVRNVTLNDVVFADDVITVATNQNITFNDVEIGGVLTAADPGLVYNGGEVTGNATFAATSVGAAMTDVDFGGTVAITGAGAAENYGVSFTGGTITGAVTAAAAANDLVFDGVRFVANFANFTNFQNALFEGCTFVGTTAVNVATITFDSSTFTGIPTIAAAATFEGNTFAKDVNINAAGLTLTDSVFDAITATGLNVALTVNATIDRAEYLSNAANFTTTNVANGTTLTLRGVIDNTEWETWVLNTTGAIDQSDATPTNPIP